MNGPSPNREAEGLYDRWLNDLRITKNSIDPTFRRMCIEDLRDLQKDAHLLLESDQLGSQEITKMKLITQRSVSQWLVWCKASSRKNFL
jgi:hypothetical protein